MRTGPFAFKASDQLGFLVDGSGSRSWQTDGENHGFVSVELPKQRPGAQFGRQTQNLYGGGRGQVICQVPSNKYRIITGTLLSADQPARRIICGSQLHRWIEGA